MDKCNSEHFATRSNARCCKRNCVDECVTKANQLERKERMKNAAQKKAFLQARKERNYLLRALEKNKNFRSKFQAQSLFESISTMTNLPIKVDNTLDSVKGLFDQLTDVLENIRSVVDFPKAFNLLSSVTALYRLIQNLISGNKTLSVIALMDLCSHCHVSFSTLTELCSHLFADKDTTPTGPTTESFIDYLTSGSIITGIGNVVIIFLSMMATAGTFDGRGIQKQLADFGRASIGFKQVAELTTYLINFGYDLYYKYILGKSLEQVQFEKAFPQLKSILERAALLTSNDFKTSMLDTDRELCKLVIDLDSDIEALRYDAMRARRNEIVSFLNARVTPLRKIFDQARDSPAHVYAARPAPTTLWVYGRAGVGKSNLVNYFKTYIYSKQYKDNPTWNPNNFSLTRCAENEYWDGYHGQPVVLYDDMCQSKDSLSKPNPEIMEFIRAKNEAPYHLHMSSIADKKNTYFTSDYIIATSNRRRPVPLSIADPKAFRRRWDVAVEVTVNPAFSKTFGDSEIIDKDKVALYVKQNGNEAFVKDIYRIQPYDMETETTIGPILSLDDFETFFNDLSKKKLSAARDLNDSIMALTGIQRPPITTGTDFRKLFQLKTQSNDTNTSESDDSDDEPTFMDDVHFDPTRKMAEALVYGDEEFADAVDVSTTPWLLVDGFKTSVHSAKERVTALLTRVREECDGFWNQMKDNYTRIFDTIKATAQKGWTKAQQIYHWLFGQLSTNTILSSLLFGLWTASVIHTFRDVLNDRKCVILRSRTFEQLCASPKCKPGCHFCDSVTFMGTLGTVEYGMNLLDDITRHDNDFMARNMRWRRDNLDKYVKEIGLRVMRDTVSMAESLGIVTESRETMTRGAIARRVTESRETKTRGPPLTRIAESRELRTRGPIPSLHTEAEETPAHIYNVTGSHHNLRAEARDLVFLEQWESTCAKNAVSCRGITSRGTSTSVSGVFVTGRTMILPHHFFDDIKDSGKMTFCNPGGDSGTTVDISQCQWTQATEANGTLTDLVFLTIPAVPSRKNIISKFATANEFMHANEGDFVITTLRDLNDHTCVTNFYGVKLLINGKQTYTNAKNQDITLNTSLTYEVDTRAGDCGGLVYARNTLFSGKILGMHVAGHNGIGMAMKTSREFIQRNLDSHVRAHQLGNRSLVDARYPFEAEMNKPEVNYNVGLSDSLAGVGNCISLGKAQAPYAASRTSIRPSLLCGAIQEPITKPAYLRPQTIDNTLVDPMRKGIAKVLNSPQALDPEILDMCVSDVAWIHNKWKGRRSVLTFEEAIKGVEDMPFLTPLNRTSSPGYPYCLDNGEPGKRKWFGYDDYKLDPDVQRDVEELIQYARDNRRGDVVWLATLKDERRPIEKVEAGKTRVFAAGPMHYTIATRQYFLDFVSHIMTHRITNEVGVGTNPYSLDWHRTGTALRSKGPHVIAGDFSNYDGSLLQDVMWKICDMINEWYDDGPENAQIRNVLFEEICNARVLVQGELIQWTHSQPSGNPLTVIINSLFNQIIMRYAYMLAKKKYGLPMVCDFTQFVSMQTYGDDNVLNISESVIDWYNQLTITEQLATVGLTYTDEGKTGELVASRKLEDVSYLKRKFQLNSSGQYSGPLDIGVCYEMANWIRGLSGRGVEATVENATASLRELYFHGKETFNKARKVYEEQLQPYNPTTRFPTFDELRHEYAAQLYG